MGRGNVAIDSILASVSSEKPGDSFENCDVIGGKFSEFAAKIMNCFSADPQFVSPKLLNYQLRPISPCRGQASDGGDLGVRYTPGMIEILKKAFELQEQGLVKF